MRDGRLSFLDVIYSHMYIAVPKFNIAQLLLYVHVATPHSILTGICQDGV